MTDAELVQYYVDLLIIQYKTLPKASATVQAYMEALIIFELIDDVNNGYDLDTAIGAQLDVLGKYIGVERTVTSFPFDRDYFGYLRYGETSGLFLGYSTYGNVPDVQMFTYNSGGAFDLTDSEYRLFLQLKAKQNIAFFSLGTIDQIIFDIFGTDVSVEDLKDMKLTYTFLFADKRIGTILFTEDLLPRTAGVQTLLSFA